MHELGHQQAFRVRVDPADQHSHGRHGQRERKKKGEPVGAVRRSRPQIIDDW